MTQEAPKNPSYPFMNSYSGSKISGFRDANIIHGALLIEIHVLKLNVSITRYLVKKNQVFFGWAFVRPKKTREACASLVVEV